MRQTVERAGEMCTAAGTAASVEPRDDAPAHPAGVVLPAGPVAAQAGGVVAALAVDQPLVRPRGMPRACAISPQPRGTASKAQGAPTGRPGTLIRAEGLDPVRPGARLDYQHPRGT